ncbi:VID27-domain-containing protein [Rhizophagus irregularis]|uniref:VID27-domain-containing protein n=1 Tax=Rhizophagus irregularis TaxID=588596 RepID=A0A2I1DTC7_9GLOM|nr:VID27-domain-containing protein [Rhizophagus irregularis]PKC68766.1 VID27-domain-containing protein [Rhizophagus irregularis]PKK79808.1 VID27-domain-containing protein [Rhizophagus irregularis]PKY13105.1 VID27-domain-containing protein [Rhizophagus irregularis]
MNVLKSLGKLIWGNPDNPELIKITNGELYLVRPNFSIKGTRECIFHTAQATVRRTGTEWQYHIVISRVFDEGEEELELQDEEEELEEEKVFLIDESLKFRKGQIEGLTTFSWRDLSGDPDDLFEFVCDISVTAHTVNAFEYTVYNCMFERKYRKSRDEATEQDIQSFIFDTELKIDQNDKSPPSTPKNRSSFNKSFTTPTSASTTPMKARNIESPSTPTKTSIKLELPGGSSSKMTSIIDVDVELHVFDPNTATFLTQSPLATASILKGNNYEYWLNIEDDNQRHVTQKIEPRMNPVFNSTQHCLIWVYFDGLDLVYSFLIKFQNLDNETNFKKKFTLAMYETLNETKAKDSEEGTMNNYNISFFFSVFISILQNKIETGSSDEDDDNDIINTESKGDNVNTQLSVGQKLDRSFILKGNKIGVFKHTDDDKIEFTNNIDNISKPQGKKFNPSKMMLHEGDSNMILMDENDEHSLFKMDLEYGKVVEEWKVHDIIPVENIFPINKFAQTTGEKSILGLSYNSIYSIDPRLPNFKLVNEKRRQYVTKNDFISGATDASGHIAVGTEKGDIKLFDSLGKIAKTNLPAMGSAIKGIDVTSDGKWLIATTDKYLLLINTEIKSDPEGRTGFKKSFAKDEKPKAKTLQLKPEHLTIMGHDVNFTPARFNTGEHAMEKTILSLISTGPYVIAWNFRRVKQGKLFDYQIKRYDDDIVADNFRFGQDKSIVVTLPHDVTLTKKTHLSTPTKSALSPSKKSASRSRNNIAKSHEIH